MDTRSKLVIAGLLLGVCGPLFAGYAAVSPSAAFSGSPGAYLYRSAANDVIYQGMIRTAEGGTLNLAAQAVKMPAAMRFASNAGVYAARAVFLNPALAIGVGVAAMLYEYYTTDGSFVIGNGAHGPEWEVISHGQACASGCFEYQGANNIWYLTQTGAVNSHVGGWYDCGASYCNGSIVGARVVSGAANYQVAAPNSYTYWTGAQTIYQRAIPPYDTTTMRPATEDEFKGHAYPLPFPDGLPLAIPDPLSPGKVIPLPVEDPVILPNPQPVPDPYPEPAPGRHPLRVPLSDPVPVPAPVPLPVPYSPTWKQPVIDIVPSPVVGDPWRVDLQPKDIVSDSPSPLLIAPPVTPPVGSTAPAPTDTAPDLCVAHPEIIACQKFTPDTVDATTIPDVQKNISIVADSGWGPSNGSCPAPKVITVQGKTLSFSLSMLCDFATAIRPLFLALAWISSIMLMLGIGKKG